MDAASASESGVALVVRRATSEDARALAELAERTFRHTFADANTPADMDDYLARSFGEAIQRAELEKPEVAAFLAERHGETLGYAMLREGGEDSGAVTGEHPVELQRLYVVAEAKGGGVAQALLRRVEEEARERGGDILWLGVWEKNPRAIAFYGKTGFVDVGAHDFLLGRDLQRDRLMQKPLG
jgi:ribosomal protein S18 acetylase RimI-like enzyme